MKAVISAISLLLLSVSVFLIGSVETTTCTQGSLDIWLVSLFIFVPATAALSGAALIGRESRRLVRWFTLPLSIALPFSGYIAARYFVGINMRGEHPCTVATGVDFESFPLEPWVPYWAPIHLVVLAFCGWVVLQFWFGKANG